MIWKLRIVAGQVTRSTKEAMLLLNVPALIRPSVT
jgi:hypothetical protein